MFLVMIVGILYSLYPSCLNNMEFRKYLSEIMQPMIHYLVVFKNTLFLIFDLIIFSLFEFAITGACQAFSNRWYVEFCCIKIFK